MAGLVNVYGTKRIGGQEEISNEKARLIYDTLDKYSDVHRVVPGKSVRSRLNICFRVHSGDAEKEKAFLAGAEKKGLLGLKVHRSVGGIRASNSKYPIFHPINAARERRHSEAICTGTGLCYTCIMAGHVFRTKGQPPAI